VVDLGDVRVVLTVAPRPPTALAKRFFRVKVEPTSAVAQAERRRVGSNSRKKTR
jgi:hypothetical protein